MRDNEQLTSLLESLLLVSAEPVSIGVLAGVLEEPRARIADVLRVLAEARRGGIRVQLHEDQAQLVTAPENSDAVRRLLGAVKPAPLSRPALEVLAVVAYRQPVTRAEIEAVRGVNGDRALQTLLARGLVEERGHRAGPGRPAEYGTSFGFLEYFGLTSLDDLPPLEADARVEAGALGLRTAAPGRSNPRAATD